MRIHDFASEGDCDGVQAELRNGTLVDARDEHDFTPLACACGNSAADEKMLKLLIDSGADVNAGVKGLKKFPLGLAACSGSLSKVQHLLDAGANVSFVSPRGYTVLIEIMYALYDNLNLVAVAEFLLKNGAVLDWEATYSESPLTVAAYGHLTQWSLVGVKHRKGGRDLGRSSDALGSKTK